MWNEVVIEGVGQPGAAKIKAASWIRTQAIVNKPLVQALRQELAGDAEASALPLEIEAFDCGLDRPVHSLYAMSR